ncbi:MAG: DNA repair protein RadC [Eubacterium sp.]|nr:DNA repair protein RadC [Eubacterium sp.]
MDKKQDGKIGHRGRMIHAYSERGSSSFEDYQMLEMLLFYVIPRKDVKPIAKSLLTDFGSLENVLAASKNQLMKTNGVGNETATFLNFIYDVDKRLRDNRCKNYKIIETLDEAADCFKEMFQYENKGERFAVMMLDNSNGIINCRFLSEGSVHSMEINIRKLVELVISFNAVSVVIAHNHPNGIAYPSNEDINFTLKLRDMLSNIGVYLADHIILNNDEAFSMHSDLNFVGYFEKE